MPDTAPVALNEDTGQPKDVPDYVLGTVDRANEILKAELKPYEHLGLKGEWGEYAWSHDASYQVNLRIFTSEYSYSKRVRVQELRGPLAAKDFILDVILDFSSYVSSRVGESIQQIRSDLKKMLAS